MEKNGKKSDTFEKEIVLEKITLTLESWKKVPKGNALLGAYELACNRVVCFSLHS